MTLLRLRPLAQGLPRVAGGPLRLSGLADLQLPEIHFHLQLAQLSVPLLYHNLFPREQLSLAGSSGNKTRISGASDMSKFLHLFSCDRWVISIDTSFVE